MVLIFTDNSLNFYFFIFHFILFIFLHKTGHDVFFNLIPRDLPPGQGGCCDCGDEEALDANHFCSRHSITKTDPNEEEENDPLAILPQSIINGGRNILHYALNCFSEMDMYESMRRDVRGVGFSKNNGKKKSKQELKDAGVWQRYPSRSSYTIPTLNLDTTEFTTNGYGYIADSKISLICPSDTLPLNVKGWGWTRMISWLNNLAEQLPTTRILLSRAIGIEMHPSRRDRYPSNEHEGYFDLVSRK